MEKKFYIINDIHEELLPSPTIEGKLFSISKGNYISSRLILLRKTAEWIISDLDVSIPDTAQRIVETGSTIFVYDSYFANGKKE